MTLLVVVLFIFAIFLAKCITIKMMLNPFEKFVAAKSQEYKHAATIESFSPEQMPQKFSAYRQNTL